MGTDRPAPRKSLTAAITWPLNVQKPPPPAGRA